MEGWLILLGVMLPLAPTLEALDRHLSRVASRNAAVPVEPQPPRPRD
jgi:hypothetical protein